MRSIPVLFLLVGGALLPASALDAQVEVGAIVGVLAPTSTFEIPTTGLSIGFGPTEAKLTTALTYGALARAWVAPRLGLQATVAWTSGTLLVQPPFSSAPDTSYALSTTIVAVSFLYRLSTPTIPNAVWLAAGPMWITQESPRYADLDGTDALGIDLGIGSSLPLNERLRVSLSLDGFIYPFTVSSPTDVGTSSTQFDFRALAGVSVHFGHDPE